MFYSIVIVLRRKAINISNIFVFTLLTRKAQFPFYFFDSIGSIYKVKVNRIGFLSEIFVFSHKTNVYFLERFLVFSSNQFFIVKFYLANITCLFFFNKEFFPLLPLWFGGGVFNI